MLCALMISNVVVEVRDVLEEEMTTEFVNRYSCVLDVTNYSPLPEVGQHYENNVFTQSNGQPPVVKRRITKLGLRRRLTFTELCTLTAAAKSVVQIEALMGNLMVATFIDLDRADTVGGFNLLVSLGLLTSERANQILSAPITDDEKYKGNE